jgi:hypothetical protein
MPRPVEDDVLVDLVGNHHSVSALQHACQLTYVVCRPHHAGRVVWRVHHDDAGARSYRPPHLVPVDAIVGVPERDVYRFATAQNHGRGV